jgi:mono/diheme cytochrome c family protein
VLHAGPTLHPRGSPVSTILKTMAATAVALVLMGALAAALTIHSGIYPIAADRPHLAPVRWLLTTVQQRSVMRYARGIEAPALQDAELVRRGLELYRVDCVVCHGAPGVPRQQIGRGINPNPPPLFMAASEWTDAQLYWIIRHGLKMAGMPAFDAAHSETDLWALTAFTRRLPDLTVGEYAAMVAALEGRIPAERVAWVDREDPGWARLLATGTAARGKALVDELGCGSCHVVPGVRNARGKVGPSLERWAERHFIAGSLLNQPTNLTAWIMDPHSIEPGTAMPAVGVTPEQAWDIAAYLYTLGAPPPALRRRGLESPGD